MEISQPAIDAFDTKRKAHKVTKATQQRVQSLEQAWEAFAAKCGSETAAIARAQALAVVNDSLSEGCRAQRLHQNIMASAQGEVSIRLRRGACYHVPLAAIVNHEGSYLKAWLSGSYGKPAMEGNVYLLDHIPEVTADDFQHIVNYYQGLPNPTLDRIRMQQLTRAADVLGLSEFAASLCATSVVEDTWNDTLKIAESELEKLVANLRRAVIIPMAKLSRR